MEFVEIVLVHAGERSVLSLLERLHCGRASRRWREAVLDSLPTLRALDFRGCETRITEPGVLAVLAECWPSTWPEGEGEGEPSSRRTEGATTTSKRCNACCYCSERSQGGGGGE